MVNDFRTKKSEDLQSTLDHRLTARSEPAKKLAFQKKNGSMNAEEEKLESKIIWVSATQNFPAEGEKQKVKNHENTSGNVTDPQSAVWEINGHKEIKGDKLCGTVEVKS